MDLEEFERVMGGLYDRLIGNFRKVPNWDMYVANMETKKKDFELPWEMNTEQLSAHMIWKRFNVWIKGTPDWRENPEAESDLHDIPEDATDEEIANRYIYALASWILKFEREELA